MRPIQEPVRDLADWAGGSKVERLSHPAFAQIGVTRSSGGHTALYGSDFNHNAYLTIRIAHSDLQRDLAHDWPGERRTFVEVALSEAQWATFVSSPNMGSGVQCTLQSLQGEQIPGLPDPVSRAEQFAGEARERLDRATSRLDEMLAEIDALGLPKGKVEKLKSEIRMARQDLASNLPFVAKSFEEHTERVTESAKAEIHGYMTGVMMRAGLAALTDAAPPLLLTNTTQPTGDPQ
jgi:hypothetical protein